MLVKISNFNYMTQTDSFFYLNNFGGLSLVSVYQQQ